MTYNTYEDKLSPQGGSFFYCFDNFDRAVMRFSPALDKREPFPGCSFEEID
ncbi:hypothetical protein EV201_0962 [Ancylomarina subtilis]|uniref:Uncharacterized protein n=1 Tax=Ancylomarina subtilis TaxID=1639035 RepID=A0A4Q7VJP5_9BACT|nr:hypothetical protein EV201_0962 [Ancylomarina subtilis]